MLRLCRSSLHSSFNSTVVDFFFHIVIVDLLRTSLVMWIDLYQSDASTKILYLKFILESITASVVIVFIVDVHNLILVPFAVVIVFNSILHKSLSGISFGISALISNPAKINVVFLHFEIKSIINRPTAMTDVIKLPQNSSYMCNLEIIIDYYCYFYYTDAVVTCVK